MDLVLIAVLAGIVGLGYIIYDSKVKNSRTETYNVDYSELLGNGVILEHSKLYKGVVTKNGKSIKIKGLRGLDNKVLHRPKPPEWAQLPSLGKFKKIYIIKLSEGRYAYRVPKKDNHVWTYKRDEDGNVVKINNQIKLVKHKWELLDDVVEIDDRAWYDNISAALEEKHRKKNKWDAIMPALATAAIFVMAIIGWKFLSEDWKYMVDASKQDAEDMKSDVDRLLGVLEGYTGTNKDAPPNEQIPANVPFEPGQG